MIRILSSCGVSLATPDTLHELQQTHPYSRPPVIPTGNPSNAAIAVDVQSVVKALRSFQKGTSCGRDGLRAQHLLDATSGSAAAVAEELLQSVTGVVNLWLDGKCPLALGEFVASTPLTPLLKPGGGIRPIAVDTIWRRLCSKMAASAVLKDMTAYLGNHQFGVGTPCSGEGILHSVNRLLEMKGSYEKMTMLLIDFTNAFNIVNCNVLISEVRDKCPSISKWVEFCYARPSKLYYNEHTLSSAQGVQQGDPLGPLLLSLSLHPLVCKIATQCKLDLNAWYLDDGTLIGETNEVDKALQILRKNGPEKGLKLNIQKTEFFWPQTDPICTQSFPSEISRPTSGVCLLGGPVSMEDDSVAILFKIVLRKLCI